MMNKREAQKFNQLYTRFDKALHLQGYSASTIEAYTFAIRRVADYFDCCPSQRLRKDDLRDYFADLLKTHSWSTIKRDRNGLMRFWELILEVEWDWVPIVKPPAVKPLPDILSPDEITRVLAKLRKPAYRAACFVMYTLGLRIGEVLSLQVGDIDYAHHRVHIRQGKGRKDRFIELPDTTYQILRQFWTAHRHPLWLFPSQQASRSNLPMDRGNLQVAIRDAVKAAGIRKRITAHSLRHCYATHLIEHGLNLRGVQTLMGHEDPRTTALYTQLTGTVEQDMQSIVNHLAQQVSIDLAGGDQ